MFYEGFRITYSQTIWSVMAVRVFNNNALSLKAAASKVIPFDIFLVVNKFFLKVVLENMLDLSDLPLTLKRELEKVHWVESRVMILVMRSILIIALFTLMTKVLMTFTYMMTLILFDDDQVHQFEGRYLVVDVKEEVVEGYLCIHIKHRNNCECCQGHYLIVNHYSSMSWFNFRNLSVIVSFWCILAILAWWQRRQPTTR